jgi:predicted ester cyclase
MTPDVVYEETGTQRRVDGVDADVQLCQGWKQAFPDVRGEIRNVIASGNTVVQEIIWEGTHTGTLEGPGGPLLPSGRHINVPASLWITFSGDQGKEVHHHLDVSPCLGS